MSFQLGDEERIRITAIEHALRFDYGANPLKSGESLLGRVLKAAEAFEQFIVEGANVAD